MEEDDEEQPTMPNDSTEEQSQIPSSDNLNGLNNIYDNVINQHGSAI